ncbi:DUF5320 domain-containing protein [Petroclostridium sp. X23]|uniref:DUF5320 domain-containing protein n=1 Tax=Petroclostridium sp. X23 TaxID=3045146 RepID=UPI0024AD31FF|nr:DUF5320 domain-containing protein [Petroclostridium sp. X23]WHH59505.1 DUF5320 domain-containing protein [Petroclostridium sp. X23]
MPRRDATGPMGMGSMTGRGAGYCTGRAMFGLVKHDGVGFGRGIGGGRGFRKMFCAVGLPGWPRDGYTDRQVYDEKTTLKNQEEFLEKQLKQVKDRLKSFDEEK